MTLSERSRLTLYHGLVDAVGDEEAVGEMLSYFSPRDVEEPMTKEFFRAETAITQAEVQAEFAAVRAEMAAEFTAVRSEIAALEVNMHDGFRTLTTWMVSLMVTMMGVVIAAVALMR